MPRYTQKILVVALIFLVVAELSSILKTSTYFDELLTRVQDHNSPDNYNTSATTYNLANSKQSFHENAAVETSNASITNSEHPVLDDEIVESSNAITSKRMAQDSVTDKASNSTTIVMISEQIMHDNAKVEASNNIIEITERMVHDNITVETLNTSHVISSEQLVHNNVSYGNLSRLCPNKNSISDLKRDDCILLTSNRKRGCPNGNINGPTIIKSPPWISDEQRLGKFYIYFSSHNEALTVDFASSDSVLGPWNRSRLSLEFNKTGCASVHSPDVLVDTDKNLLYMYMHGHSCKDDQDTPYYKKQPTYVMVSRDGLTWSHPNDFFGSNVTNSIYPMVSLEVFYMRMFKFGDYYYSLGKEKPDPIGFMILSRSESPFGPFINGPRLKRAARHMTIFVHKSTIFIFYTMIRDKPEKIMLGTIHLKGDWKNAKLFPFRGPPTILKPTFIYEHGNANIQISRAGGAGCRSLHEVRDPYFFPDGKEQVEGLSGYLYYTVRGESAIAVAHVDINFQKFREAIGYELDY